MGQGNKRTPMHGEERAPWDPPGPRDARSGSTLAFLANQNRLAVDDRTWKNRVSGMLVTLWVLKLTGRRRPDVRPGVPPGTLPGDGGRAGQSRDRAKNLARERVALERPASHIRDRAKNPAQERVAPGRPAKCPLRRPRSTRKEELPKLLPFFLLFQLRQATASLQVI